MKQALTDLQKIHQAIQSKFGNTCLNYGEAHEIITENQGSNYVSIADQKPCSVDDNFDLVLFLIRESWEPIDMAGGGMNQVQARNVSFKLCANAKGPNAEYDLVQMLNKIVPLVSGSNDAKQIAQTYFGLDQHNFETYFFSVDFTVKELILCERC